MLSFGKKYQTASPNLASASGLSFGSTGAGPTYNGGLSLGTGTLAPARVTTTRSASSIPLSFGTSVPKYSDPFMAKTPYSFGAYGRNLPASPYTASNRAGIGGAFDALTRGLSFGTPATSSTAGPVVAATPQAKTVTMDGSANAIDRAKALAGSIFGDMLQQASFNDQPEPASLRVAGGAAGTIGATEIVIGVAALGAAFYLLSGSKGGSAPRRRRKRS